MSLGVGLWRTRLREYFNATLSCAISVGHVKIVGHMRSESSFSRFWKYSTRSIIRNHKFLSYYNPTQKSSVNGFAINPSRTFRS